MQLVPNGRAPCAHEGPGRRVRDQHETAGVLDGQRAQHEAVDQGEDRGVRADAEGERQDGNGRHDGRGAEGPNREAQVSPETLDEAHTERISILFLDLIETAEFEPCPADGLCTREPAGDVRFDLVVEVKP